MVTGSPVLLSLLQWENKNVDLITLGLLIFSIHISGDLLCPIILILPHPTHLIYLGKSSHLKNQVSKTGSNRSGIGMASTRVCEKTKFIREIALCSSVGGRGITDHDSASSLECELASSSWYELAGNIWCVVCFVLIVFRLQAVFSPGQGLAWDYGMNSYVC